MSKGLKEGYCEETYIDGAKFKGNNIAIYLKGHFKNDKKNGRCDFQGHDG